jgi:hypothetical protein
MNLDFEKIYEESPGDLELSRRAQERRDASEHTSSFKRDALAIGGVILAAIALKAGINRHYDSHYTEKVVIPKPHETLWHAVGRGQGFDEDRREEVDRIEKQLGTTDLSRVEKITVRDH